MAKEKRQPRFDWSHRHWSLRPLWLANFRRRRRWLLRLLVALPLLVMMLLIILAHSPVTRAVVLRELRSALNLDVQADSVYVGMDGRLVMERVRFRIPGVDGPAGQFLNVAHIEADVDWWSVLTGDGKVSLIRMVEPVLIVSQSTESDRTLNLERFHPPASARQPKEVPAIEIKHAGIEVGEHTGATYKALKRVQLDGRLFPRAEPGAFAFTLHEYTPRARKPGAPSEPGFVVTGSRSQGRITVTVENFSLDDWPASSVPTPVRQLFTSLELKGDVPRALFAWAPDTGITAQLVMQGVGMNLAPLTPDEYFAAVAEGAQGPFPEFVRMREVQGSITFSRDNINADVRGNLEDLPYSVKLRYEGLEMDSPFTCEFKSADFRVDKNPSLLPYAPPKVREWLRLFTSPTAVVTTDVSVSRGPAVGGTAAEIKVKGSLTLKEGTAAYARFPYEFRDMTGLFEFDNDHVKVVSVKGRSASGAQLEAHGTVEPLDDTAEVRVDVSVRNAPIDQALEDAFGPDRKQVIQSLFNSARYQELLDAGFVQTPADAIAASEQLQAATDALVNAGPDAAGPLRERIAALQRRVAIPAFAFRGAADVDIKVLSPRGKDTPYQTQIDIRIPRAGLVPEKFPLPVVATDVTARIENDDGRLTGGVFRGLDGGTSQVRASFRIPSSDEPEVAPEIQIAASDVPFTPLLIHALPGADATSKVKAILRDLNLSGLGKGTVNVAARRSRDGKPLGFDADFDIQGCRSSPADTTGQVVVSGISGKVIANEDDLAVDITGRPATADDHGRESPAGSGELNASIKAQFGNGDTTYQASGSWPGLTLGAPVEPLVRVFSIKAADQIARLRAEYRPAGAADVSLRAVGKGDEVDVWTHAEPRGDVSVHTLGDELVVTSQGGSITVRTGADNAIVCEGVRGPARFGGEPCGGVELNGEFLGNPSKPTPGVGLMTARMTGVGFDSAIVRQVLSQKLSAENLMMVTDLRPRGLFDADVEWTPDRADAGVFPAPVLAATLRPARLEFVVGPTPVVFESMSGQVRIEGGSGVIKDLGATAAEWSAHVNGAWDTSPAGDVVLRAQMSGKGSRLSPDLRATLPPGLVASLDEVLLKIDGPLSLDEGSLSLQRTPDHAGDWTRFDGTFAFSEASLEAGVSISDLRGGLDANFSREAGQPAADFRLGITADGFRIGGITLGHGKALLASGDAPGEVVLTDASGECYAGRYAATARMHPEDVGSSRVDLQACKLEYSIVSPK